jgi:hypothetical protein
VTDEWHGSARKFGVENKGDGKTCISLESFVLRQFLWRERDEDTATTEEAVSGWTDCGLIFVREREGRAAGSCGEGRMIGGMVVVGEQDVEGQRR